MVEQAIETAALMLGMDKSRGYCLEMICADFLAGGALDGGNGNPDPVLQSQLRFFKFLNPEQREGFVVEVTRQFMSGLSKPLLVRLDCEQYEQLHEQILRRDGWRCQLCGAMSQLQVHHLQFRSQSGEDSEENLITLCRNRHDMIHCG